jgi:hypothetical protein
MIMTTNKKSGKRTIPQLEATKLAETFTMEEAKANLFLKQQAMTMIKRAKTKAPTASKIRVVLLAIND